ncbi:MAG: SpoIIE family protein phosphatase [Proteobacteria bacterium]|nr:SpoIIE family protein phosphatase [Pseudomonadota bacterium]
MNEDNQSGSGLSGAERLARQNEALQTELRELSIQYDQALAHISHLKAYQAEMELHRQGLEQANVRISLLAEELETREQAYREQAESLAKTSAELDMAHKRLVKAYDDLRRERSRQERDLRRMENELELAGSVQRLLIPAAPPENVPGLELSMSYTPASEASGDWLGFWHNHEADELSIFIGDVTGHGLGSALITAGVFSAVSTLSVLDQLTNEGAHHGPNQGQHADFFHTFLGKCREPQFLVQLLDGVVAGMGHGQFAMTLFAAVYHIESRVIRYVNAGHCLPILLGEKDVAEETRGRAKARALVARGAQLGLSEIGSDPQRDESQMQLEKNDLLLFYTDGLSETRNDRNRELGVGRLVRWLRDLHDRPVDAIRDALRVRIEEFANNTKADDDIAFVIARVTE